MIRQNDQQVNYLAQSIRMLRLAPTFAEQTTPKLASSRESTLRAFLWAAAICHSTKGDFRGIFDGVPYKGWDYLLRSFCAATDADERVVAPQSIVHITASELVSLLSRYAEQAQVNLPDAERRAEILRECANELLGVYDGSVAELLARADEHVGGTRGAYAQLANLSAFRDPLRKKSSAFLMSVHFSGLWPIRDPEAVAPMVDYHLMRVLCRTGCITIDQLEIREALMAQQPVADEIEEQIREAAAQVCSTVVQTTGISMFDFDVLLWAHARSCCRHYPVCTSGKLEHESFYSYISEPFNGRCEFQSWCQGATDAAKQALWEPKKHTEYY